jgi:hypothetical protein
MVAFAGNALALGLAKENGEKPEQARAHDGLARAYHAHGDPDRARHHWQAALSIYTDLQLPETEQVRRHARLSGIRITAPTASQGERLSCEGWPVAKDCDAEPGLAVAGLAARVPFAAADFGHRDRGGDRDVQ